MKPEPRLEHYPEIMTVQECASYLQMAQRTLVDKVQGGCFPHFKLGRQTRFKKSIIDQWAEQRTEGFVINHTRTPKR